MRTLYDSVTPGDIPVWAPMVAGYVSGPYAWSAAGWARFPNAVKVRIATQANVNDGHVLDVESGDALPGQAPGWVQMRRTAGVDPTIYCSLYAWPAVKQAFAAAGVPPPHYWIAAYNNQATLYDGAVAHQYADPPASGGHWDLSCVADYWPGVDEGEPMTPAEWLNIGRAVITGLYATIHRDLEDGTDPNASSEIDGWAAGVHDAASLFSQVQAFLKSPGVADIITNTGTGGVTVAQVQQIAHDEVVKALKAGEAGA